MQNGCGEAGGGRVWLGWREWEGGSYVAEVRSARDEVCEGGSEVWWVWWEAVKTEPVDYHHHGCLPPGLLLLHTHTHTYTYTYMHTKQTHMQ